MRLLKRHPQTGRLCFTNDLYDNIPAYAILSHTWGPDEHEISYQDIMQHNERSQHDASVMPVYQSKHGYDKLDFCLNQAAADGLDYVWIDTCCIDKRNAVELNKAINNMFRWYQAAQKCYVYLEDVSASYNSSSDVWVAAFRNSRWFTRGWTLQELIAPSVVCFYSREKAFLGTKERLAEIVHSITGVPISALRGTELGSFSVEERFSWASSRTTKEPEDRVYSLLGIMGVPLSQNYGEGEQAALVRLKAALTERYHDGLSSMSHARQSAAASSKKPSKLPSTDFSSWKDLLYSTLDFKYSSHRRSNIRAATARTCEWVLEHETYLQWSDDSKQHDHHGLLWIKGKPGAGKSTLIKFLDVKACQRSSDRDEFVLSFYFNARGSELEKTIDGLYRSLICQLLDCCTALESAIQILKRAYGPRLQSLVWSTTDLQHILATLIQAAECSLLIFVDALDECREDDVKALVEFFEDLTDAQSSKTDQQLRICLASRH